MRDLYNKFLKEIDTAAMMRHTEELLNLELGQTFSSYQASSRRCAEIMKECGLPNVEIIEFPADGKTAYQDKISPLGWEASTGSLTVVSGDGLEPGFVLADYKKHPFHLIKGSVATAPGGEIVRILTDERVLGGDDPHDALVMVPFGNGPRNLGFISRVLDLGARGIITDYTMNAEEYPDGIQWCNAFTERANWHITQDDRPFVAFSISPRMGKLLRKALVKGEVVAKMESDARRFESSVNVVTALIPGKRKEEFWITAHLYEPLANDNSSGVAAAIETARILMEQGGMEYSLRLVFGLEHYGFAAYAATCGTYLGDRVIGSCNYDAMYLRKEWKINFRSSGPASPFFGNFMAKLLADDMRGVKNAPEITYVNSFPDMYEDDSFLSDPTVGIPAVWPIRTGPNFWHNSRQTIDYIEKDAFTVGVALHTAYVSSVISFQDKWLKRISAAAVELLAAELPRAVGSQKEHLKRRYDILCGDLDDLKSVTAAENAAAAKEALIKSYECLTNGLSDEITHSKWRDFAGTLIIERNFCGFPYDLAAVPPEKRVELPGWMLYSPLAAILADMDGKRTLAEIIRMVEHEICRVMSEAEVRSMLRAVIYLEKYGYLKFVKVEKLNREDVINALKASGVKKGDFLLFHSSLTAFGIIDGGAATVVSALREVLGEEGTVLFPVLTFPYVFIGEPNRNPMYRPYDPDDLSRIWTGAMPRFVLAKCPDAVRSRHVSHAWCGFGKLAAEACAAHQPTEAPMSENSPLAYALKAGGKIIHFGNSVGSTTFLHFLEDKLDLPGLDTVLIKIKKSNGYSYCASIPRNLPADRDFYHGNYDESRFFKAAVEKGLHINTAALGIGEIVAMSMEELYKIGCDLLTADPNLLLLRNTETDLSGLRWQKINEKE